MACANCSHMAPSRCSGRNVSWKSAFLVRTSCAGVACVASLRFTKICSCRLQSSKSSDRLLVIASRARARLNGKRGGNSRIMTNLKFSALAPPSIVRQAATASRISVMDCFQFCFVESFAPSRPYAFTNFKMPAFETELSTLLANRSIVKVYGWSRAKDQPAVLSLIKQHDYTLQTYTILNYATLSPKPIRSS